MDFDELEARGPAAPCRAATSACTAFTSELFPIPREPHSSALLAGSPAAKFRVLVSSVSRIRSTDLSSAMGIRLTWATGANRFSSACQLKASATAKSGAGGSGGDRRSRASAMRRRAASSVVEVFVIGAVLAGLRRVRAKVVAGLDCVRTMRYFTLSATLRSRKVANFKQAAIRLGTHGATPLPGVQPISAHNGDFR